MSVAYTRTSSMPCIARVSVNARRAPRATQARRIIVLEQRLRAWRSRGVRVRQRPCVQGAAARRMRTALTRVEGVGDEEESTGSAAAAAAAMRKVGSRTTRCSSQCRGDAQS